MKTILVITASKDWASVALSLISPRPTVYYRMEREELLSIGSIPDLNVFDMIVVCPIHWKIPKTSYGLVAQCRKTFMGPIVCIGSEAGWRALVREHGADHLLNNDLPSAAIIRDLLADTKTS